MAAGLQGLPGMLQHHPGSHWEYQWAGSSHRAGMEVLEMAPCGAVPAAAVSPWLQHSEASGPVGGRQRTGAPGAGGILGSEPARATGSSQDRHWEHTHPVSSAQCQSTRTALASPRSGRCQREQGWGWSREAHPENSAPHPEALEPHRNGWRYTWGDQTRPAPQGGAIQSRDLPGHPIRATVPECSTGAELC